MNDRIRRNKELIFNALKGINAEPVLNDAKCIISDLHRNKCTDEKDIETIQEVLCELIETIENMEDLLLLRYTLLEDNFKTMDRLIKIIDENKIFDKGEDCGKTNILSKNG